MENWYYVSPKTDESVGPVSIGKLIAEATPATMVWKEESLPEWVAANAHPDLADFQEVLANNSQELSETKSMPNFTVQEVDTSTYNLIIYTEIVNKLAAVKVLQDELACSLTEAAQLVETIPALVKSGLSLTEAETLSKRLAQNGIIVNNVRVENVAEEIPVEPKLEKESVTKSVPPSKINQGSSNIKDSKNPDNTSNQKETQVPISNAGSILTLGILALIFVGGIGAILGVIALLSSNSSVELIKKNPNKYEIESIKKIKNGRVLSIISISFFLFLILIILVTS
jgi:ribosomal protein L7/L12